MASQKREILYGFHPVYEALRANRRKIHALLVRKGRQDDRITAIRKLAKAQGLTVQRVEDQQLADMADRDGHQGVCARVTPLPFSDLSEVMGPADSPRSKNSCCSRSNRSAAPRPSVSKASAGALEHMPIARVPNLVNAVRQLKKDGLWIVGLEGSAEQSLFDCDLKIPLGLIIGGEERGLRPLVTRHCDFLVSIPHARAFNSLNASVAAALAIFEAYRQKSQLGGDL